MGLTEWNPGAQAVAQLFYGPARSFDVARQA
jgi:hypothetical protein